MTSTTILITLTILVILVFVYFVIKKSADVTMLQKLTGRPLPIKDRIAGEYMNLQPGTLVQRSGNYECIMCANGGLQDAAALFSEADAYRRNTRKPTRTFFQKDIKMPLCPNCGSKAGWTLMKQ